MTLRIKNWQKHQHFKDRKPPWLKLYRDLLDDVEWHELDPLAAKTLVSMWLIAGEDEGYLPCDKALAFRLRISEKSLKSIVSMLSHWLEQVDINVISECHQSDSVETETETETERVRVPGRVNGFKLDFSSWPSLPDHQILSDWMAMRKRHKADLSQTVINRFAKQLRLAVDAGISVDDCLSECVTRSWRGFEAEWIIKVRPKQTGFNGILPGSV